MSPYPIFTPRAIMESSFERSFVALRVKIS